MHLHAAGCWILRARRRNKERCHKQQGRNATENMARKQQRPVKGAPSVPAHTEAALCASLTHRRDLLCLHISLLPSLPPPILPSFSPMHAPSQKLGTPREQLQPGFHCMSSRDTPPALQPYDRYVRMFVCLFASVSLLHPG